MSTSVQVEHFAGEAEPPHSTGKEGPFLPPQAEGFGPPQEALEWTMCVALWNLFDLASPNRGFPPSKRSRNMGDLFWGELGYSGVEVLMDPFNGVFVLFCFVLFFGGGKPKENTWPCVLVFRGGTKGT